MAVGFDAKPTAYNSADGLNQQVSGATSISAASGMSIGGSANLLVGQVAFGAASGTAPTGITMTWNSVSMTQEIAVTHTLAPGFATTAEFSLANPATGSKTLAAAWTNANDCYMSCASWTGAQINVAGSTSATATTTININTTSDGATMACFGVDGAVPTVNQTKIWAEAPLTPGGGGSYALGGSGTNSHTFTGAGGGRQALTGVQLTASAVVATTLLLGQACL